MQKRKDNLIPVNERAYIDIKALQDMFSIGRIKAEEIGKNANAVIKLGRRKVYNVEKIKAYLNELSEV